MWCRGTESNRRHGDFQSPALPTELPRRTAKKRSRRKGTFKVSGRRCQAENGTDPAAIILGLLASRPPGEKKVTDRPARRGWIRKSRFGGTGRDEHFRSGRNAAGRFETPFIHRRSQVSEPVLHHRAGGHGGGLGPQDARAQTGGGKPGRVGRSDFIVAEAPLGTQ